MGKNGELEGRAANAGSLATGGGSPAAGCGYARAVGRYAVGRYAAGRYILGRHILGRHILGRCVVPALVGVLWGLLTPGMAPAQLRGDAEGLPIVRVEFQGLSRLEGGNLRQRLSLTAGNIFHQSDLNQDYRQLWESGEFSLLDPRVTINPDGVTITFVVEERRRISTVTFEGVSDVRESELRKGMRTVAKGLFNRFDARLDAEKIRRVYLEKGFYFGSVSHRVVAGSEGLEVIFDVYEGPRVVVEEIRFLGNSTLPTSDLIDQMATRERSGFFGIPHAGYFHEEAFETDLARLRHYYRFRGFLDVVVSLKKFAFSTARDRVYITLEIVEGAQYRVERIDFKVKGEGVFAEQQLREVLELEPGDVYDGDIALLDEGRLLRLYRSEAYIDANIRRNHVASAEGTGLTVVYDIDEGRQISIDSIVIKGNEQTKDKVIRRELTFYPQELMNVDKFQDSMSNLFRLNYFDNNVQIYPEPASTSASRDVIVEVGEGTTGQVLFGFGVTSGLGAIGNIRLVKRNFDISDLPGSFFDLPNAFTGGGQTLVIEAQPGTEFSSYNVNFIEPYLFDSNTGLSMRVSQNTFGRFEYLEQRTSLQLGLSQRYLDKRLTVGLNYRFEVVDISQVDPGAPPDAFAVEGSNRISGLGFEASYDARTYRPILGPVDGWLARAGVEYTGGFLGADIDQTRANATYSWHKTIASDGEVDRHIVTFRNTVQWAEQHHNTNSIPLFERYFLGGARTVRGFRFLGLGPHINTEPIGGAAAHFGSFEYTFPLVAEWLRGVGFVDYGNLATDLGAFKGSEYRLTTGGGVILTIPFFGQQLPISLTWGQALFDEDDDRTRLFLFDIGRIGF